MIRRIINKIKRSSLGSRVGSYDQFKSLPTFRKLDAAKLSLSKEMLRPYFEQYVREVSRPDMAMSLELAAFMLTVCEECRFKKVLDMGSGFSSFVFRWYALSNRDVEVYSVDDDPQWLEKTRAFLLQHQLETRNMLTLGEFLASQQNGFECILHDLNFVEVRIGYLKELITRSSAGGLVVLDDIHKPDYQLAVLVKLKDARVDLFTLRPVTLDSYGRFAFAALKEHS